MLIQVVRGEIGHHRDIRAAVHTVKLKGTELQHGNIVRPDIRRLAQERMADVAAKVHPPPRSLEKLRNNCRGCGLPVASGDGDDLAGAEGEKHLHLRCEDAAALLCRLQVFFKGHEAWRAKQNILVKSLQIIRPKLEFRAKLFQAFGLLAHLLTRAHIAGRHVTAVA